MLRKFLLVPPEWSHTGPCRSHDPDDIPAYSPEPVEALQLEESPVADAKPLPPSPIERTLPSQTCALPGVDWLVEQLSLSSGAFLGGDNCKEALQKTGQPSTLLPTAAGEKQDSTITTRFRSVVGYKDMWISPPFAALQRWQEAGLQPISGPLTADYAVLCPQDTADDTWLMLRNVAACYKSQGLGSLLQIAHRLGSVFAYDAQDCQAIKSVNSEGTKVGGGEPRWLWNLRAAALKLRRSLTNSDQRHRLAGNALGGVCRPLLVFVVLPSADPKQVASVLRVIAQVLGSEKPTGPEPTRVPARPDSGNEGGEQDTQAGKAELNGALYGGVASMAYRWSKDSQTAAPAEPTSVDCITPFSCGIQVVAQEAVTDISGDTAQGLPFSIFPKLSRLTPCEALEGQSSASVGTKGTPLLCMLRHSDWASRLLPREGGKWKALLQTLYFSYTQASSTCVPLAWSTSTAWHTGCKLVHIHKDVGRDSEAAPRPSTPTPSNSDARPPKRRRVSPEGPAENCRTTTQEDGLQGCCAEHVKAVLGACLEVCSSISSAAGEAGLRVVISSTAPMSDDEAECWRRALDSPPEVSIRAEEVCIISMELCRDAEGPESPPERRLVDLETPGFVQMWKVDSRQGERWMAEVQAPRLTSRLRQFSMEPQPMHLCSIELVTAKVHRAAVAAPVCGGVAMGDANGQEAVEQDCTVSTFEDFVTQIAEELYNLTGLNQVLRHLQSGCMAADSKRPGWNDPCPYHCSISMRAAVMYRALLHTQD